MLITKLNESYLKISDVEYDEAKFINDQFSFYAENYRFHPSFKMKRWDGKIRLFNMRSMTIPIGCYDKLISLCKNAGIFVSSEGVVTEEVSIDETSVNQMLKDDFNCDLVLRDYQLDATINAIRNNKCVSLLPTSSGKSLIQFTMINYLLKLGHIKKALLIVPTVSLVSQMEFDFLDYAKNVKDYAKNLQTIYSGRTKEINSKIVISTWQSLQELVSGELVSGEENGWFGQWDCLVIDECHTSSAKVLSSIVGLCTNAKFKFGVSGTLQESKVAKEQLESLFGQTHQFVTTKELIDNGTLTPIKIYNLVLNYNKEDKKKYETKVKAEYDKNKDGAAKKYQIETNYIQEHKGRQKFILQTVKKCKGNTLILFKNIKYGEKLTELINKYIEDRNVYFVDGDVSPKERERIRLIMEQEEDAIILATLSIFSTGINIKKLKYLMFVQPIKSKIKVLQSIGRVLRKHDTKVESILIDIVDNITGKNFSVKHAMSKLELYEKEGFNFKVKEINL